MKRTHSVTLPNGPGAPEEDDGGGRGDTTTEKATTK